MTRKDIRRRRFERLLSARSQYGDDPRHWPTELQRMLAELGGQDRFFSDVKRLDNALDHLLCREPSPLSLDSRARMVTGALRERPVAQFNWRVFSGWFPQLGLASASLLFGVIFALELSTPSPEVELARYAVFETGMLR